MTPGELGGLNYRMQFPQQNEEQFSSANQSIPQQYNPVPYENDPLAVREKLTTDYYNNAGLLRSFVQDMISKGIDPFQPDYSQDGGGLPFQTFQKLQAGLMFSANALKNEFEAEKDLRPLRARNQIAVNPGVNPNEELWASQGMYTSTEPLPFVKESNNFSRQNTHTRGDEQRNNQAYYERSLQQIDQMEASGQLTPYEAQIQRANLQKNVSQTAYQQLVQRGGGSGRGGLSQEDLSKRAELIKQVKKGILTDDQTPLNLLKLIPGVEEAEYVNTGDRVGLNVYVKGQGQPSFVDLRKDGAGDINALLNRIEGQKNVPNEMVFSFDTKVDIPESNARETIETAKAVLKNIPRGKYDKMGLDEGKFSDVLTSLQDLSRQGILVTPENELIASIEPASGFFSSTPTRLKINYYKLDKKGEPTSTILSKEIKIDDNQDYIEQLVEANANEIAQGLGAGFSQQQSVQYTPTQQRAVEAFTKQLGRQPNQNELQKILSKYK
jgi:hypothetical protein